MKSGLAINSSRRIFLWAEQKLAVLSKKTSKHLTIIPGSLEIGDSTSAVMSQASLADLEKHP